MIVPVCVRAVLSDDHLQLAEAADWCSVSAGGELEKQPFLLFAEGVNNFPKIPATAKIKEDDHSSFLSSKLKLTKELNSTGGYI